MAKLKLDDILRGLGDPDPSAPKEAEVRPAASAPAPASPAVSVTGVARQPAEEIPRPPDAAGTGLGKEVETDLGARDASPLRARPDDALSDVYTPEEQLQRGEPLDLLGTLQQKGVINPEQVATAERVHQELLRLIHEEGLGALVATHNHELAAGMSRIALLDQGRIIGV